MRAFMLLVLALATPAAAQPVATCEGGLNPGRILACTELLRADQSPDRAIAIYKNRAQAYRSSGQNDLALKDYDTVLTVSPKEPEAIYGRGWALYSLKFHNRALADADRLIAHG